MKTQTIILENELKLSTYMHITGMEMTNCTINEAIYSGSLLTNNVYSGITFRNCTFYACNLDANLFLNCRFENCSFQFSHFHSSSFENCEFVGNQFATDDVTGLLEHLIQVAFHRVEGQVTNIQLRSHHYPLSH